MSDPTPTTEPQSVTEVQGTLSQVAREAEAPPAPEPVGTVDVGPVDELEPELLDEVIDDEPAGAPGDEPPAIDDPFAEYGGKETVQQALALHKATQSEDGVIQLFLEAGKQLGLGLDKIEALFTGTPAPAAGEPEYDYETDPERPLTVGEFQAMTAKQQAEFQAAQQRSQIEQARAAASTVVQSAVSELGLTMEDEATQVILNMGNKYLPANSLDPVAIKAAVERGHADYLALVEKERKAYIASKRKAASNTPSAPAGGAAPSAGEPAEPKDVAEASKRVREMLRDKGVTR